MREKRRYPSHGRPRNEENADVRGNVPEAEVNGGEEAKIEGEKRD